ncbi:MAG: c-type cytochrome biogenesis protein CcmI/CycH [Nitrospiria bacterium]
MFLKTNAFRLFSLIIVMGTAALYAGCNKNETPVGSSPAVSSAPAASNSQDPYGGQASPQAAGAPFNSASGTISGTISIDPKLAGKVDPNAVLFISAKPAEGPQVGVPPLAAQRVASPKFPLQYTLSQADIIMQGATLSGQLNIVVKLMKNGAAGPVGSGDIEGHFAGNPVNAGQKAVDITLDTLH